MFYPISIPFQSQYPSNFNNKYPGLIYIQIMLKQQISSVQKCICVEDYREYAQKVLPPEIFYYIDSGSDEESTKKNNEKAFQKYVFITRVLRDGSSVDFKTSIFGVQCALPFGFAPWAINALVNSQEAEMIPAKIASEQNIGYILSTLSSTHPSKIAKVNSSGLKMLQIYITSDWKVTEKLIQIAEANGFHGIVITLDAQVIGTRRKQMRYKIDKNKYKLPILEELSEASSKLDLKGRDQYLANRDLSLNWNTIAKIRSRTKLKIVLKGILSPKDAEIATEFCDAIYVSNHGGRQLDTVQSTVEALPAIAAVVKRTITQIPIFVDGGVRNGSDIFKFLALGADYVFMGRPVAYALTMGYPGVKNLVDLLKDELFRTMVLTGALSIKQITSQYLGIRSNL